MLPNELIIYSDMDGTLLTSWDLGPIVSKNNMNAISDFIEAGGLFSIATGRNLKNGPTYLSNLDIKLPMVLVNGALLYDAYHKKVIKKTLLSKDFLFESLDFFVSRKDVSLVISDVDEVHHVEHPKKYQTPKLDFITNSISIDEIKKLDVLKITFVTYPQERYNIENEIHQFNSIGSVILAASSTRFIEVVDCHVNKGDAILEVIQIYNLHERKLVCIGDYLNDAQMLEIADIAAIPQNGLDSLKTPGRLITSHHNEDAIFDLIHQLKLKLSRN